MTPLRQDDGSISTLIHLDDPQHRVVRAIGADWFRPKAMRAMKLRVDELARRYVDKMAAGSECDFVQEVAVNFPLYVIMSLLGVPEDDFPRMLKYTQELFGNDDAEFSQGASKEDQLAVLVCAHGKHDQCCAVRGRGAAAAIEARYPEFTWECSHLGGDRFAATMLVLPEGLCYGRIDSTDAAELVRLYLDGRLDNKFLRGRTSLPHAVQAAQHFAREESGDDRIDALSPIDVQHGDHGIRVVLDAAAGPLEVVLAEEMSGPLRSMCRSLVAGPVRTYALVSISPTATT